MCLVIQHSVESPGSSCCTVNWTMKWTTSTLLQTQVQALVASGKALNYYRNKSSVISFEKSCHQDGHGLVTHKAYQPEIAPSQKVFIFSIDKHSKWHFHPMKVNNYNNKIGFSHMTV